MTMNPAYGDLTAFPYAGSKKREQKKIIERINGSDGLNKKLRIAEPFLGTGRISYLIGKPNECYANDGYYEIANMMNYARDDFDSEFWIYASMLITEDNKKPEFFYERREEYNNLLKTDLQTPFRSALFLYIIHSSHGGMMRFNPKTGAVNISFKVALVHPTYTRMYNFDKNKIVLQETARRFIDEIYCEHANNWLHDMIENIELGHIDFIYCDPPYANSGMEYGMSFTEEDREYMHELLDRIYDDYGIPSLVSDYIPYESAIAVNETFEVSGVMGHVRGVTKKKKLNYMITRGL